MVKWYTATKTKTAHKATSHSWFEGEAEFLSLAASRATFSSAVCDCKAGGGGLTSELGDLGLACGPAEETFGVEQKKKKD
jgi:hypothetical protein